MQKVRFVSIYIICKGKPNGLRTQYQQIKRYLQKNNVVDVEPRDLFNMDFVNQCAAWIREGEEVCAVGDINDDVVKGGLTKLLSRKGI